jgi:hypothetical protein
VPSPYEEALGGLIDELHPRLRAYFSEIPSGSTGVGTGTFDTVGTPRLWLWPALVVLGAQGIAFAAWRRRVPFTVLNHPIVDAFGYPAILAHRLFRFRLRTRRMEDAITAERGRLVDHLGFTRRLSVQLDASVTDGRLTLRSRRVSLRAGRIHLPLPRNITPSITLIESFDDSTDSQNVSVTVDLPRVGRVYEYSGSFSYEILAGEHHG